MASSAAEGTRHCTVPISYPRAKHHTLACPWRTPTTARVSSAGSVQDRALQIAPHRDFRKRCDASSASGAHYARRRDGGRRSTSEGAGTGRRTRRQLVLGIHRGGGAGTDVKFADSMYILKICRSCYHLVAVTSGSHWRGSADTSLAVAPFIKRLDSTCRDPIRPVFLFVA